MNEFYLHEAQAQLQLALFGASEAFMDETNLKIRRAFNSFSDPKYIQDFCMRLLGEHAQFSAPSQAQQHGDEWIHGPLSKVIGTSEEELLTKFGNAIIFAFAGHDTTGHTMTWLTYELSKHPEYQRKLHEEVDRVFEEIGGRELCYEDCQRMPFLTKCVMETLRLWPAVPSGTYRELQFDDTVKGPGGKDVVLPKGTFVQVATWGRHRNPDLWGADVNEFNPYRKFNGNECWNDEAFAAYNPHSERFSPFTYPPRDCIGKNFAQMEMRAILAHVFRRFSFKLGGVLEHKDQSELMESLGVNRGTMGPRDLSNLDAKLPNGFPKVDLAMPLHATPRQR